MPSRWGLADKVGHTLVDVHGPVPAYAEQIGTATDRLMQRLMPDRILARLNWSIIDRPDLFQPVHKSRVAPAGPHAVTPEQVAAALYVRMEYQTVRAFPDTASVLFTIHTAREPLSALATRPGAAADLLALLDSQDEDHHVYKGVLRYLGPLRAYLASPTP